jgi:histidinol phosphatase-like enzyme (inositol monophosphatase family)
MQPVALTEFVAFAQTLADTARAMLAAGVKNAPNMRIKADRSFVTDLDEAIERKLRDLIGARFPGHGVRGEEGEATRADAEYVWVLDPIDGTAPFIAGVPVYGTLIALARRNEPVIGVMDFPATDDRWVGAAGQPTTHNGVACATRRGEGLAEAMQATMNPDFFAADELIALNALKAQTAWRIYGTSAFSYGLLASGRIDVTLDTRLKPHDFAAFRPVIEGAGGVVTDWAGKPLTLDSGPRVLAAGDARRHALALQVIEPF